MLNVVDRMITKIMIKEKIEISKEECLAYVADSGYSYHSISDNFKNDKDIIITALNSSGYALNGMSSEIVDNPDYVEVAINKDYRAFMYASYRLQHDETMIEKTLIAMGCNEPDYNNYSYALGTMEYSVRDNELFVSMALNKRNDMKTIEWASSRIQDLVGNNDPATFLNAFINKTKLENKLNSTLPKSPITKRTKI